MSTECVHPYDSVKQVFVDFCIDDLTQRREKIDFCSDCKELLSIHGEQSRKLELPSSSTCQHDSGEVTTETFQVKTTHQEIVLYEEEMSYCPECRTVPDETIFTI